MSDHLGECTEPELVAPVELCTSDGRLSPDAIGWARRPLIDCSLPGSWGRRKRWDFWCVTGPGVALSLTYANVDYLGLADVWFHDFERDTTATATYAAPLGSAHGLAFVRWERPARAAKPPSGPLIR